MLFNVMEDELSDLHEWIEIILTFKVESNKIAIGFFFWLSFSERKYLVLSQF